MGKILNCGKSVFIYLFLIYSHDTVFCLAVMLEGYFHFLDVGVATDNISFSIAIFGVQKGAFYLMSTCTMAQFGGFWPQ